MAVELVYQVVFKRAVIQTLFTITNCIVALHILKMPIASHSIVILLFLIVYIGYYKIKSVVVL